MADPLPTPPPRPTRTRLAAVVALWTVVVGAASIVAGCYGHNCDGDVQTWGGKPGEGRLLSADLWESSPIDGVWLDFPKQRIWIFEINDLGDRRPEVINTWISAQKDPTHEPGGNFTQGGGNLTEISGVQNGRMVVKNGTCADYFLRVTAQAAPFPPRATVPPTTTPASADAGGDAGAGP